MRLLWRGVRILAIAYAGIALLLYFSQSRLVFYPEIGREQALTPAQVGLPYEDINLTSSDGVRLHGWFLPAPQQQRGTVLFLHGNAGNISHRLDFLQMFWRMGYGVLIFDYRGYGASAGEPTEQGTYRDAEAAWRYLVEQRNIPPCGIVLYGESLGGAIAARLAARQSAAVLVVASGFTSVPDLAQQLYPYLPVRWLAHIRYPALDEMRAVRIPVFVAHSPDDEVIPYAHGQQLYAAAHAPKQFLELAGGHNDGFIFMREHWVQALARFLERHARTGCSPPAPGASVMPATASPS